MKTRGRSPRSSNSGRKAVLFFGLPVVLVVGVAAAAVAGRAGDGGGGPQPDRTTVSPRGVDDSRSPAGRRTLPSSRRSGGMPKDGALSDLERRALREEDPRVWRPALLRLAQVGTPEACGILARAIRDGGNHARASDAVGALARFPRTAAVEAFQRLLREKGPHLAKLRALQGLVLMLHWTPADAGGATVLTLARESLRTEGAAAAFAIERDSKIAAFRHESRQIRKRIENLN